MNQTVAVQYRLYAGPHLAFVGNKLHVAKRLGVSTTAIRQDATFPRPVQLVPFVNADGKRKLRPLWSRETQYRLEIVHV